MKKIISLILSLVMMLSFTACGTKAEATWQEHYDIGIKYVNEAKYEEAILSFTKALEIDPKQAPVYIALAEVYVQQENYTAAAETLDKAIAEIGRTDELTAAKDKIPSGTDYPGAVREDRHDLDDGRYFINYYDEEGNCILTIFHDVDGTVLYHLTTEAEFEYYDNGNIKTIFEYQTYQWRDNDKPEMLLMIYHHDENGELIWANEAVYFADSLTYIENDDGSPAPYSVKGFEEDGRWWIEEYDADGYFIRLTEYDADGSVVYVEEP